MKNQQTKPIQKEKGLSSFAFPRLRTVVFILVFFLIAVAAIRPQTETYPPLTVAVAEWRHEGGTAWDIQQATYQRLQQRLAPLELYNVTVITIPIALGDASEVDAVALRYGVDILIWGWYDSTATRSYVDLAFATDENGMGNSLSVFLKKGGNTEAIRVLKTLSDFDYDQDGVYFCVPRWTP